MNGTVRKKGTAGNWQWLFVVRENGERRTYSKAGFPTKKAAQLALRQALEQYDAYGPVKRSTMTLERYLVDEWLPARRDLKPSTLKGYQDIVNSYVTPHVGRVELARLSQGDLVRLYVALETSGKRDGTGVSSRTLRAVHNLLTSSLSHAVEAGYLRISPAAQIPRGSRPAKKAEHDREMSTWSRDQVRAFLGATSDDRWHGMFAVALGTGMRRGELVGLRWEDVDLDRGVLRVRRARVAVGYAVDETTPKSGRARTIPLDSETTSSLRTWRRRQLEERMAWGPAWQDSGLVFTREDGSAVHPGTASWHFERAAKASGLPVIRFHDLRHTHATLLLEAGVPAKVVQERLGHANIRITLDLYAHVTETMQDQALAALGSIFRPGDMSLPPDDDDWELDRQVREAFEDGAGVVGPLDEDEVVDLLVEAGGFAAEALALLRIIADRRPDLWPEKGAPVVEAAGSAQLTLVWVNITLQNLGRAPDGSPLE